MDYLLKILVYAMRKEANNLWISHYRYRFLYMLEIQISLYMWKEGTEEGR